MLFSSRKTACSTFQKVKYVVSPRKTACSTFQKVEHVVFLEGNSIFPLFETAWDLVSEMCTELGLRKCGECDRLYGNVGKLEDDARTSVGMKCGRCAYVSG